MARRGGKRRRRGIAAAAAAVAGQATTNDNTDTNKRQKVSSPNVDTVSDVTPTTTEIEVSYHGNGHLDIPPPLNLDDQNECQKYSDLSFLWNYFAGNNSSSSVTSNKKNKKDWKPSKIQSQLWPILLQKQDRQTGTENAKNMVIRDQYSVIGIAPTGSGKTLAYGIPTILSEKPLLVLVPTRELVQQVTKVYTKLCKGYEKLMKKKIKKTGTEEQLISCRQNHHHHHVVPIYGGVDRKIQKEELELSKKHSRTLIIVATPGRLLDLLKEEEREKEMSSKFGWIIMDEADQLSKDGDLGPQVEQILQLVRRRTEGENKTITTAATTTRLVLVSATFPDTAKTKFQQWIGNDYNHVLLQVDHLSHTSTTTSTTPVSSLHANSSDDKTTNVPDKKQLSFARIPDHLKQVLHVCSEHKKPKKLLTTLQNIKKEHAGNRNPPLGIVFFSKIEKAKYISKLLEKEGVPSIELHSQLSTFDRSKNLQTFQCGKRPLLLATDVAARGIDIPSVNFVIQYDFPGNLQQYIHRCGRAGRGGGGSKATVYSFFTRNLKPLAADMIQLLESTNAWVDPNLRELLSLQDGRGNNKKKNNNNNNKKNPTKDQAAKKVPQSNNNNNNKEKDSSQNSTNKDDQDDGDDDDFPELLANRIVLKRASHVSDASSSSSEDEADDEE